MTAITPTHWVKFLNSHSEPSPYTWSQNKLTDPIWSSDLFDWEAIIKAFSDNGIKYDTVYWNKHWKNNYIYFDKYCDDTTKKPSGTDTSKLSYLYYTNYKFNNLNTRYTLGYKGYASFGDYFRDLFAEAFYNNEPWVKSKATFTQKFIDCFIEAWKDTSKRIELKEKKKTINQRVQKIESDVDNVILDLGEEFKEYDVELKKEDEKYSQSIVCSYHFKKKFYGYVGLSQFFIRIRKDLKGNYDMCWSLDDCIMSKMVHFKSDISGENMSEVIKSIFGPYLNIPATAPDYSIPKELLK